MKKTVLFSMISVAAAVSVQGAEWLGTGGNSLWGTAANWGGATVPVGNIAFSTAAGDNKTVTLDGDRSFGGTFVISAGTAESPFVFTATSEASAASNSLTQTTSNGLDLNGALKVEGGVWNFANDIRPTGAYLHIDGGRVTTKYWLPVYGNTTIVVDGGELVSGYRDNIETSNGRLNLADSADAVVTLTQNGGRIRCSNNTNGGNDAEALTVGSQARTTTTVNLNGGELVVNGKVHVGYGAVTKAEVNVDGGKLTATHDILIGRTGNGTLNIDSGVVNCGSSATVRYVYLGNANSATAGGTLNLNGGVLTAGSVRNGSGTAASVVNFNGGKLKATVSRPTVADALIPANEHLTLNILAGGAFIDTDVYNTTIAHALVSGVEEGVDGGLVKTGLGILNLSCETSYTGATVVSNGVLGINEGHVFAGSLQIGAHGTVVVNLTNTTEIATVAVDGTIRLFKASSLTFEAADDTLATSVFLTGPVIGYTLSTDAEGWVVATVTDVANVGITRKVTTFLPDDANDTATARHIDQDSAWSNGQPRNDTFDVCVFSRNATICYYAANNRRFGDFVIRHARVVVKSSNSWPTLGVRHIAGVGTLAMGKVGYACSTGVDMVADETIVIECSNAFAATTDDTWFVGNSNGLAIVNGTVVATNGCFTTPIPGGAVFNGEVIIGNYPAKQSFLGSDTVINGTLTVLPGVAFNINSKLITQGPNMTLNLAGGTLANVGANIFTNVTISAGGDYAYADIPAISTNGTIRLDGGYLTISPAAVANGAQVTLVSGTLAIDASASGVAAVGGTLTLTNVAFAAGATLGDMEVLVGGLDFDWDISLNGDGRIVATARTASEPNRWIGGSEGYWKDAGNWARGMPSGTLPAQFDTDALVWIDADKTVSNITVNAEVTFKRSTGNPTLRIRELSGSGTLGLYHTGLEGTGEPRTVGADLTLRFVSTDVDGGDSWLKNLKVYAPLTGAGFARIYAGTEFYGDNSAFTGHFRKDDADTRFMTPESGLPHASYTEIYGTLWLWFNEGTITFSRLTMSSTGNRGINLPAGVRDGSGLTMAIGNDNGNVDLVGANTYETYSQNGGGWIAGCDKFTIVKLGSGTFGDNVTALYNLSLQGGVTTFKVDNSAAVISVGDATIAAAANRTIGAVSFGEGAKIQLNTNAVITATGNVDVTGVAVAADAGLSAYLSSQNAVDISPSSYGVLAATGTISGVPAASQIDVLVDGKVTYGWRTRITENVLCYARKYIKPGFFLLLR